MLNKKGGLAVFEAVVLVASIIAFSYFAGQEFHVVNAQAGEKCLADKKGVLLTPGGSPVKVDAWTPEKINQWCIDNGNDFYCTCVRVSVGGVCDSGTGNWSLGQISCSSQSSATNSTQISLPVDYLSIAKLLPQKPITISRTPPAAKKLENPNIPETPVEKKIRLAEETAQKAAEKKAEELAALKGNWAKLGGSLLRNAATAATIYAGVKFGLQSFGVESIGGVSADKIAQAVSAGYFAGSSAGSIYSFLTGSALSGIATFGIGVAVMAAVLIFNGQERQKTISFSCLAWDAPTGGSNCEKCNNEEFPCTEYRCRSLGQQCELANKGTTEELCVYVNRLDTNPPVIQPWIQVLTNGYNYAPDGTISTQDRGVKIIPVGNLSGCVAPFTPLKFGITLNQPAKCKIDTNNTANFSEMDIFLSSGRSRYNHSFQMSLPSNGSLAAENITLQNGGKITIYTRCENAAGRVNVANFIFNFCVDQGPDRTPPNIVTTSILNGMPIAFGQESVDLQVFVNEPSECRWSHSDKTYDDMISDNNMTCSTGVLQYNAQQLYQCSTTLTGLNDRVDNDFYFKCLDQPHLKGTNKSHERNEGPTPSYKFTLKGTEALVINSAGPNNTVIKDSTNVIKVVINATTSAGADEGKAICSFRNTATDDESVEFFNTGTHKHSQDLFLPAANYNFLIGCVDLGGNNDTKLINFTVETDTQAPSVVRVFRQENKLKVITTEESQCVYGNFGCDYLFKDGTNMSKAVNGTEHSTAWDTNKIFYIKCSDKFGNQPFPNQCNIVAKPFEIK